MHVNFKYFYFNVAHYRYFLRIWENGVNDYSRQQTFPPIPSQCQPWGVQRVKNTPFQLNDFAGVFVISVGGTILSIFIFIAELVVFRLLLTKKSILKEKKQNLFP